MIIDYIEKEHTRIHTIEQIAAEVHLHPNYISTLFNKELGVTVNQYINQLKIAHAKLLLEQDDNITVEAVAEIAGFQTTRKFYKVFKETIGVTPGKYRTEIPGK